MRGGRGLMRFKGRGGGEYCAKREEEKETKCVTRNDERKR